MGLDMYAYSFDKELLKDNPDQQVGFSFPDGSDVVNLDYWRKFNHLHGWMERLYREKGGDAESFNCVPVRLMPEDITRLENDWKEGKLTSVDGFFFGSSGWYPEYDESLAEFIAKARKQFEAGRGVLYDSWW